MVLQTQVSYSTFKFEGLGIHENGKTGREARGELTGEMVEMKKS